MKERLDPMKQAVQEMPYRKWEKTPIMLATVLAGYIIATGAMCAGEKYLGYINPRFVGGAIYAICTLADNLSTVRAFNNSSKAREMDIDDGISEGNIIFGKEVTTSKEFLLNKKHWALEIAGATLAVVLPEVGVGFGVSRGIASIYNLRGTKRTERAIEIAQQRIQQPKKLL